MQRMLAPLFLAVVLAGCAGGHYGNRLPGGYQGQYVAGRAALKEGDETRAAELLAAAARSGHPYALIEYARLLAFAQDIENDWAEAIRLLEDAYAKSSARKGDAAFYLGRFLIDEQPDRALKILLYARAKGRHGAEYEIGNLLADRGEIAEAEQYWREAAAAGRVEAQEKMAELYQARAAPQEARRYGALALARYRERAEAGDIGAMRRLAHAYAEGVLVAADIEEHWFWVERAAEAGDVVSQGVLARGYLEGRGRPIDGPRGQLWAERAIDQGYAAAKAYLGRALLNGEVLPKDVRRAETLLQEAAAAGHAGAQTDLGRVYLTASLLPRDILHGLRWLEAAVDQGSASAMTVLGYAYWKGDGVPRDRLKAEDLLSRAATLGPHRPGVSWPAVADQDHSTGPRRSLPRYQQSLCGAVVTLIFGGLARDAASSGSPRSLRSAGTADRPSLSGEASACLIYHCHMALRPCSGAGFQDRPAGCAPARSRCRRRRRRTRPRILQSTSTAICVVCKSLKKARRGFGDSSSPSAKTPLSDSLSVC